MIIAIIATFFAETIIVFSRLSGTFSFKRLSAKIMERERERKRERERERKEAERRREKIHLSIDRGKETRGRD